MKRIILCTLMIFSLTGCTKDQPEPVITPPVETIQPEIKSQNESTEQIKETSESLIIDAVPYETAPMDSIDIISIDEDGNMQYIYNDIEVIESETSEKSDKSDKSDNVITSKKHLVTENDDSITVSEVEETESQESLLVPAEFDTENTLSDEEVYKLESEMIKNIDENTMKEAKESLRIALKDSVRILIEEGHSEFESFTDEVIDSMSEEEIAKLNAAVDKAIRGY